MKNSIVRIMRSCRNARRTSAKFCTKPTIRAVGVSAEGQEISPFTVEVTRAPETRVYGVPMSVVFKKIQLRFPAYLVQVKPQTASAFVLERLFGIANLC